MNEKQLFPDYEPKKTPDLLEDYLPTSSEVFVVLNKLKPPELNKLHRLLEIFNKYEIKMRENPGGYRKGNVALGADLDQYYPSEEEMIISEIGKMIKLLIESSSPEEINDIKLKMHIKHQTISFNEIYFRHVDVMGSGRFYYAAKRNDKTIVDI
ncbi:MAG: hypothetical protein EU533_01475 [Promethearchaeota archaeon]|nr:MAG: hypothetical protein EU533_01475 [Candidatus Lokiarchaeota archaeon]